MKKYQKAQMIAKNLPTGSYAAGCPTYSHHSNGGSKDSHGTYIGMCSACEIAQ